MTSEKSSSPTIGERSVLSTFTCDNFVVFSSDPSSLELKLLYRIFVRNLSRESVLGLEKVSGVQVVDWELHSVVF